MTDSYLILHECKLQHHYFVLLRFLLRVFASSTGPAAASMSAILTYSPDLLLALRPQVRSQHRMPAATAELIRALGLLRRARGCRAGRNIQRSIETIISSRDTEYPGLAKQQPKHQLTAATPILAGIPRQPSLHRPRTTTTDSMNESHVTKTSTTSLSYRSTTTAGRISNEANLVRPVIQRHLNTSNKELVFGTYNARSICNLERADAVRQLRTEKAINVLFLTETWHETADDVSLRRLRNEGLQILECARPIPDCKKDDPHFINHGGIAIIGPNNIKISKLPFAAATTFKCACALRLSDQLARLP